MLRACSFLFFALLASAQQRNLVDIPPGFTVTNAAAFASPLIAPGSLINVSASGIGFHFDPANFRMKLTASDGAVYTLPSIASPRDSAGLDGTVWSLVPVDAALGGARIDLESGTTKLTTPFTIVRAGPGLFTKNYTGTGPVLANNQTGAVNALTSAAVPNRGVSLYATGLGGARASDVTVEVAGTIVPADFAGAQVTWPGLDQINFTLPAGSYLGCYVPVVIRVRGLASNAGTLSIHTDSFACAHPLGLTYDELRALDRGEGVRLGMLSLSGNYSSPIVTEEFADFSIFNYGAGSIANLAGLQVPDSVYYSCSPPGIFGAIISGTAPTVGTVTISGPGGQQTLSPGPVYGWRATTAGAPFYQSGTWQITATGDPAGSAFTQSFWIAPIVRTITAQKQGEELVVTWNPAGFLPSDVFSFYLTSADNPRTQQCRARAQAGRFVVPRETLQTLRPDISWEIRPHRAARPSFRISITAASTVPAIIDYSLFLNNQEVLNK